MGISIKTLLTKILSGKPIRASDGILSCEDLYKIAEELRIRELAFNTCVNLIANAVGKCEFKTFERGKPVEKEEYYLWNYEPNINQNSTEFLHKLIYKLYSTNEALVISLRHRDGHNMIVVADDYIEPLIYPDRMKEYKGVIVGEKEFNKTFLEKDVLHLRLNHVDIKPVVDGIYLTYNKMITAAVKNYTWASGKHLKVHVDQIAQGNPDFTKNFQEYIDKQVRPWLNGDGGVLPEFDGYKYENMGGNPDTQRSTRDIRALVDDIYSFTANAFGIPPVLLLGDVAGTKDAMTRWLTTCIDPLCDQLQEEITRKRYQYSGWKNGNYLQIDTTKIIHFDMFENASNVEKLIGSGAYSINDVREAAGQPIIDEEWAKAHFLTKNITTMDEVARILEGGETIETNTNVGDQTAGGK